MNEVTNEEILLYNLHKISIEQGIVNNSFPYQTSLGLIEYGTLTNYDSSFLYNLNSEYVYNLEIPLNLTRSYFPSHLIKNQLIVRIYFRGNITAKGNLNNEVNIFDIKMILRMKESSHL